MASGGDVPHDLSTFVIEAALDIRYGFWGCVAEGATFRTLGRKRTPQGRAVISKHLEELDRAEHLVNEMYFAWRRGEPTPVSDALDQALESWRRLPEGEDLVVEWSRRPAMSTPRRRRRR